MNIVQNVKNCLRFAFLKFKQCAAQFCKWTVTGSVHEHPSERQKLSKISFFKIQAMYSSVLKKEYFSVKHLERFLKEMTVSCFVWFTAISAISKTWKTPIEECWVFSRFLNCENGTKSGNASHQVLMFYGIPNSEGMLFPSWHGCLNMGTRTLFPPLWQ